MHESNRESITSSEEFMPSLRKYKDERSLVNFQKLCVEIVEFLRNVYASTRNEEEREVYRQMLNRLKDKTEL